MNKMNTHAKRIKKKNIGILLVILAIMVGHFAFQMSFIESQNKDAIESAAKTEPVVEQKTQIEKIVKIEVAENNLQKNQIKEPDVVVSSEPRDFGKKSQPTKVVQKDRQPQIRLEPIKIALKKEPKTPAKSERLRRAEKLLTGF